MLFVVHFPDFGEQVRELMAEGVNCMHGSSMFRRTAWEHVDGYAPRTTDPEDFSLFKRMLEHGWGAQRVAAPVLEYRQHSADQDNIKFRSHLELHY